MADRRVASITVSPRTIDLAGEILVISQIVRLRDLEYEFRRGLSGVRIALLALGVLLFFFGSSLLSSVSSSSSAAFMSFLGLVTVVGVLLYSFYSRRRYILAIELASGSMSGLYAKNSTGLSVLKGDIQRVIENPPLHPTTLQLGDVYAVDARGANNAQFGPGNVQHFN
jgi:hypothetical protein